MALRLVLVSMVAGLGVSPPTEGELATWTRSVQTWLETRVAEWDLRLAFGGEDDSIVAGVTVSESSLKALEEAILAENEAEPVADEPARSEDPEVTADRAFASVVEEI